MPEDTSLSNARVLLVDDDPDFVAYLVEQFRRNGCTSIETAGSGTEALEKISSSPFDLVVSDVRMPTPSGVQLAAMARTAGYQVPFLVVTAFPDAEVHRVCSQLDDIEVVGKPFDSRRLFEVAGNLMRHTNLR
jgi:CheY-like chemotaxis protein